ncbi:hypothetical protein RUND412_004474 [Rhizina undulata]
MNGLLIFIFLGLLSKQIQAEPRVADSTESYKKWNQIRGLDRFSSPVDGKVNLGRDLKFGEGVGLELQKREDNNGPMPVHGHFLQQPEIDGQPNSYVPRLDMEDDLEFGPMTQAGFNVSDEEFDLKPGVSHAPNCACRNCKCHSCTRCRLCGAKNLHCISPIENDLNIAITENLESYLVDESTLPMDHWMYFIPDDVCVTRLSIPGTRVSTRCPSGENQPANWYRQNMTVWEQLKSGVRFLEANVGHVDNEYDKLTLSLLLDTIAFLDSKEGESEAVIIKIVGDPKTSKRNTRKVDETFRNYVYFDIEHFPNSRLREKLWFTKLSPLGAGLSMKGWPTIGEARGKIIPLFMDSPTKEKYTPGPVPDIESYPMPGLFHNSENVAERKLTKWSMDKTKAIVDFWGDAAYLRQQVETDAKEKGATCADLPLVIANSGLSGMKGEFGYAKWKADQIKTNLVSAKELQREMYKETGVAVFNFITEELARHVVGKNWRKKKFIMVDGSVGRWLDKGGAKSETVESVVEEVVEEVGNVGEEIKAKEEEGKTADEEVKVKEEEATPKEEEAKAKEEKVKEEVGKTAEEEAKAKEAKAKAEREKAKEEKAKAKEEKAKAKAEKEKEANAKAKEEASKAKDEGAVSQGKVDEGTGGEVTVDKLAKAGYVGQAMETTSAKSKGEKGKRTST